MPEMDRVISLPEEPEARTLSKIQLAKGVWVSGFQGNDKPAASTLDKEREASRRTEEFDFKEPKDEIKSRVIPEGVPDALQESREG